MKIVTEDIPQKLGHEIRFRSSFQAREEIAERQHIQGDQEVDLIVHRHLSINVKSVVDDLHIHMNHFAEYYTPESHSFQLELRPFRIQGLQVDLLQFRST